MPDVPVTVPTNTTVGGTRSLHSGGFVVVVARIDVVAPSTTVVISPSGTVSSLWAPTCVVDGGQRERTSTTAPQRRRRATRPGGRAGGRRSAALEPRVALLDEGAHRLGGVGGAEVHRLGPALVLERLLERDLEARC